MKRWTLTAILVCICLLSTGCTPMMVSGKRFGSLRENVTDFVQPGQVTLYPSAAAAFTALETGYVYKTDNWFLGDYWGQSISGGSDTWLMPAETQVLVDNPQRYLDCEDGAIWLTSALRKQGLDAWLCWGLVTLKSGTYAHAWCMVHHGSTWTTYETTTGDVFEGLPDRILEDGTVCKYQLVWRTNGSWTWMSLLATGAWFQEDQQIPPDRLVELHEGLRL